ncbi:MAG: hypothetical protein M3275_00065 [Thermoproteota archaeon]|nr:hypothetical protein [Thermoproteota archaeon]
MTSIQDDRIHTLIAEEHYQPDEDEMIKRILDLRKQSGNVIQTKIFADSSAVQFIRRLKGVIGGNERTDYEQHIDCLRKHKLLNPQHEAASLVQYMDVIPIPFSKYGASMLENLYTWISRGDFIIGPGFNVLVSALQSARNLPGKKSQFVLDKHSQSLDVLDAVMLSTFNYDAGISEPEPESDLEGEEGKQ